MIGRFVKIFLYFVPQFFNPNALVRRDAGVV
jgi:hypothetical protein